MLPGIVGKLEMWHLLGSFAPRPLFIFQGDGDPLFPVDLFYQTARKVRQVYQASDAGKAFEARAVTGGHSWDGPRRVLLGAFLARHLGLKDSAGNESETEPVLAGTDRCVEIWPAGALTADALAEQLTGRSVAGGVQLWDVYPPLIPRGDDLPEGIPWRGSTRQVLAQFDAFLARPKE